MSYLNTIPLMHTTESGADSHLTGPIVSFPRSDLGLGGQGPREECAG